MTEAVIYLVQYEYVDEPGSFWPARAFPCKDHAEQYAQGVDSAGTRIYSVVPIILETREKTRTTRKRSGNNSQETLF